MHLHSSDRAAPHLLGPAQCWKNDSVRGLTCGWHTFSLTFCSSTAPASFSPGLFSPNTSPERPARMARENGFSAAHQRHRVVCILARRAVADVADLAWPCRRGCWSLGSCPTPRTSPARRYVVSRSTMDSFAWPAQLLKCNRAPGGRYEKRASFGPMSASSFVTARAAPVHEIIPIKTPCFGGNTAPHTTVQSMMLHILSQHVPERGMTASWAAARDTSTLAPACMALCKQRREGSLATWPVRQRSSSHVPLIH